MKRCRVCGLTYPDSEQFCAADGTALTLVSADTQMRCPSCAREYPVGTKYCTADGAELAGAAAATLPADDASSFDARWRKPAAGPAPISTATPRADPVRPVPPLPAPAAAPAARVVRSRTPRSPVAAVLVATAVLAVAAIWWLMSHPSVEVHNRLATAVLVTLPEEDAMPLRPGESQRVRLSSRGQRTLRWSTDPDRSVTPAAVAFDRTERLVFGTLPFGTTRVTLAANSGSDRFMAPLITNQTGDIICILINGVTGGAEQACDAKVPAGANRVFIGYYPLAPGSSVRAVRRDGTGTTYFVQTDRGQPGSGAVPLTFADRHFR